MIFDGGWAQYWAKSSCIGSPCHRSELDTNEDARNYGRHIENNAGVSSSSLPLAKNLDVRPDIVYTAEIDIPGTTLGTFIEKERLRLADYQLSYSTPTDRS